MRPAAALKSLPHKEKNMEIGVYSIFDKKAGIYEIPFFMNNDVQATRAFMNACKDENSNYAKWPEDYELRKIGTFCINNGKIQKLEENEKFVLIEAKNIVEKKEK